MFIFDQFFFAVAIETRLLQKTILLLKLLWDRSGYLSIGLQTHHNEVKHARKQKRTAYQNLFPFLNNVLQPLVTCTYFWERIDFHRNCSCQNLPRNKHVERIKYAKCREVNRFTFLWGKIEKGICRVQLLDTQCFSARRLYSNAQNTT